MRGRERRMTRVVVVAVSVLTVGSALVGLAPTAGAVSPTWQSRALPWATPGPVQATIASVSCASSTRCVAVGSAPLPAPSTATVGFVANLVRGSWLQGLLPLPAGAVNAALSSVSCASAARCVAVGSYRVPFGGTTVAHALVETFAKGAWSAKVGLDPAGATSATLSGVSCAGASACSASGTAQAASGSVAFVTKLTKGAWTSVSLPLPFGVSTDSLASISCTASSRCVAVGSTGLGVALMEVGVAGAWTATQASTLANSSLASVSCASTTACVAVGSSGFGGSGLVETMAGSTWTADTALPSAARLNSVSCPRAATTCTAWGPGPVIETLTSGTWSLATTPGLPWVGNPGPVGTCATATSCVAFEATGFSATAMFAVLTGTGGTWASAYLPGPPDAGLVQVACSTATCVGVGIYDDASGQQFTSILGLVLGQWVPVANPLPYSYLAPPSVSCAGSFCAVASGLSAAESTNGTTWTVQTLPVPAGLSSNSSVDGISCWSPGACTAVGTPLGGGSGVFAETLSGGAWSATPLPASLGSETLSGISCLSAVSCTAVGAADNPGIQSMVERLVGSTWTESLLPPVSGATYGNFADVSCTTTTNCVAVGWWYPSYGGPGNPLAAVLSGGTWTQSMVGSGAQTGGFRSVGCSSTGTCSAVGSGQAMQLAGGVWSALTVPLPSGSTSLSLTSARCTTTGWCVLAGAGFGPAPITGEVQQVPVIATSGAPAPVITNAATATATVGVAASVALQATSSPASAISVTGALPAGFTVVQHADGTATLAGKATAADVGTYHLTEVADDGIAPPIAQAFTLTIT